MVSVSTTAEYLLADARSGLRRRVADAARTELSAVFADWLLPATETDAEFASLVHDAATREGALQDFQTAAILGFGAHAGILGAEQMEALRKGLLRLAGREVVIDGLPVAFCSDAVGILGVALGTKAVADSDLTDRVVKWASKFLKNSYDAERTEDWNRCLFAAADRQLGSPLNLFFQKSAATADVRVALLAKGVIAADDDGSADENAQQTLGLAMRGLPDELPYDKAALRLAAVESVIRATAPISTSNNAARAVGHSSSLSMRDAGVHDVIGKELFSTYTNAEILKDVSLKKRLRTEHKLTSGDAIKRCLDRIRDAKEYPLSREVTNKRATRNQATVKNGQRHAS
jgi:hypothetical protein